MSGGLKFQAHVLELENMRMEFQSTQEKGAANLARRRLEAILYVRA